MRRPRPTTLLLFGSNSVHRSNFSTHTFRLLRLHSTSFLSALRKSLSSQPEVQSARIHIHTSRLRTFATRLVSPIICRHSFQSMLSWLPSPVAGLPAYYQSTDSEYLPHPSSTSPSHLHITPPYTPMSAASQYTPTVRVHHSTPSPAPSAHNTARPMLAQSAFVGSGWRDESFPGAGYLHTIPQEFKRRSFQKRKSSGSSVTSGGPPSPLDPTTTYPQIANSDLSHFSPSYEHFDYTNTPPSAHTSKPLPTPTGTPTSNSFMAAGYRNMGAQEGSGYTSQNIRRLQISGPEEEVSYAFSAPQSVSSMSHNSPATPHTNYEVDYDDSKSMYQSETESLEQWMDDCLQFDADFPQSASAAYNQALQEVFPGEMYTQTPSYPQQPPQTMSRFSTQVSPHRAMFANRLSAANQDHLRTSSPVTSMPRQQSPFRQNSPFVEQARMKNQRQQQMSTVPVTQAPETSKSVSPKELMLDEHDIDEAQATPMFHNQPSSMFSRRESSNTGAYSGSGLYSSQYSQNTPVHVPQQYPFVSQHQSATETPEFPAHMTSMESTVEEGASEPSSQQQPQLQHSQSIQRPDDTSSDAGTYTCTYHGCNQRFDTPAQLQKHKREGHRQVSPNATPTAQSIALRNSQAGPHKCERINPSTGKPCNSIFSRPYDLTRHEDTIHNARKQKVRCHLCTEEKTFSRNDALTRHMRVVHPDVDWPGKTRKSRRD